jgi:hypothetical protein
MTGCSRAGPAKSITLGEVVRAGLPGFSQSHRLPAHHWKVLHAIAACHAPSLGGHQYRCSHCGKDHFVPHSCGNRHCPGCQKLKGAEWLEQQAQSLLPIPYFHVVFTLPHDLNLLIQHNQKSLYGLLFSSASETLLEFGRNNLKAHLGVTAVLHTWGQNLGDHYHLHCVVSGGGIALDEKSWVPAPAKWLFSVRALSVVFRAKFRDSLNQLFDQGRLQFPSSQSRLSSAAHFACWLRRLCRHRWVVYAKRPFAGPQAVLAYLCRYTHRVAITNSRLEVLDPQSGTVRFHYKDYAHESQTRSMTLSSTEFLRRFTLHILPPGFVKIRHYGILSNRNRDAKIAQARALLGAVISSEGETVNAQPAPKHVEPPPLLCPYCGYPALVLIGILNRPKAAKILDTS